MADELQMFFSAIAPGPVPVPMPRRCVPGPGRTPCTCDPQFGPVATVCHLEEERPTPVPIEPIPSDPVRLFAMLILTHVHDLGGTGFSA